MKSMWIAFVILGLSAAQAFAEEFEDSMIAQDEARILYFNTSSTATTLTLLGAVILLGVIAYLVFASGLLGSESYGYYNRNDYYQGNDPYSQGGYYEQSQYRSANTGYDFNALNILQWITMMQDAYENFDFNDLECQKRLICEVLKEPEYFGNFASKARTGFHWGGQLASMVSLPDDVRELIDEYMDASERSGDVQECKEFYQCPYSIKDSIQKNLSSNSL